MSSNPLEGFLADVLGDARDVAETNGVKSKEEAGATILGALASNVARLVKEAPPEAREDGEAIEVDGVEVVDNG